MLDSLAPTVVCVLFARWEPIRTFWEKDLVKNAPKTPAQNLEANTLLIVIATKGSLEPTEVYARHVLKGPTKMKLAMPPAGIVCQGGTHKVVVVVSALAVRCIQTLIPGAQTSQIASVMQDIQDPMVGCVRLALWAATRAALAQRLVFSAHQTQCQRLAVITLLVARALKDSLAPTVNRVMPAELGFTKALQVMPHAISVLLVQ